MKKPRKVIKEITIPVEKQIEKKVFVNTNEVVENVVEIPRYENLVIDQFEYQFKPVVEFKRKKELKEKTVIKKVKKPKKKMIQYKYVEKILEVKIPKKSQ